MRPNPVLLAGVARAIHEATLCRTCGKPQLVLNENAVTGRRGDLPEVVTEESHCQGHRQPNPNWSLNATP